MTKRTTKPKRAAKVGSYARKAKIKVAPTRPVSYDRRAITPTEYGGLQQAYDHFNAKLFEGGLGDLFITYQQHAHSYGHFSANEFASRGGGGHSHELSLNPNAFVNHSDEQICSTLVHEMVHAWQHQQGTAPKRNYHNKEWAAKMIALGLMPSSTGAVGGKITGAHMDHYIVAGGLFSQSFAALAATGWKLNLESAPRSGATRSPTSKVKSTCPKCCGNAWAKPNYRLACIDCDYAPMVPETASAQSYEQAAE